MPNTRAGIEPDPLFIVSLLSRVCCPRSMLLRRPGARRAFHLGARTLELRQVKATGGVFVRVPRQPDDAGLAHPPSLTFGPSSLNRRSAECQMRPEPAHTPSVHPTCRACPGPGARGPRSREERGGEAGALDAPGWSARVARARRRARPPPAVGLGLVASRCVRDRIRCTTAPMPVTPFALAGGARSQRRARGWHPHPVLPPDIEVRFPQRPYTVRSSFTPSTLLNPASAS